MIEATDNRVTWTYDAGYRLVREDRSGGSAFVPSSLPLSLPFPLGFQLGSTPGFTITHSYDPAGNRLFKIDNGARTTFAYDNANQLRYQQDGTGRTTFSFDADGNQLLQISPTGARTTYAWDGENRMTNVQLPVGAIDTFTYNGDGFRVEQEDSKGSAQFVWDRANVLQETDGMGATQVEYTMEPLGYGALLSQRRSATSSFYHLDGLGSTDRLTNASGTITDSYVYEAYGAPRATSGATTNRFRFGGRWGYGWDPDLLNYWLRAREYDPGLARFLSQEPLQSANLTLYTYVGNWPTVLVDPTGLEPVAATLTLTQGFLSVIGGPVVGALAIGCAIAIVQHCTTELERNIQVALAWARQCARRACRPKGFKDKVNGPIDCFQKYFDSFLAQVRIDYLECATFCATPVSWLDFKCEPNLCEGLCCSAAKWHCVCGCNVHMIKKAPPGTRCPDGVEAEADGNDERQACEAACDIARSLAPRGCQTKHCGCNKNCKQK